MEVSLHKAKELICKACENDKSSIYTLAILLYEEGISELEKYNRASNKDDEYNKVYKDKAEEIKRRVDAIREHVEDLKAKNCYTESIHIENKQSNLSYEKIFGRFLSKLTTHIEVTEPYVNIRRHYGNVRTLLELFTVKCENLQKIEINTKKSLYETSRQENFFQAMKNELNSRNIDLNINFMDDLHDREIKIINNNGEAWSINSGRGIDIFVESKFPLGFTSQELRECKSCNIFIRYLASP